MVRATNVAVETPASKGRMIDRSRPVNSMSRTIVEIGPWVVAARTDPAPTSAQSPIDVPGQNHCDMFPSTVPNNAPTVNDGVNNPPGAPVLTQVTVAAGFRNKRIAASQNV